MNEEHVLVIGGGFLGSALARALHRGERRVTLLSPNAKPSEKPGEPIVVRGRQEDDQLLTTLLRTHGIVIHAAWGTTPSSSAGRPTLEMSAGVAPWVSFLETVKRFPSVRLLFLSSGGTVYGNPEKVPVAEDSPFRPLSCHGAGKAAAELFLSVQALTRPARPVVLRPSNVYGPGQPLRSGFGVLRHLLQCTLEERSFTLWGDGSQVRDYLYIDDLVDAVVRLTERSDVSGVFNIGSGSGVSLLEVISLVEHVTGRTIRTESHPAREGDVDRIVLDIGRIRHATDWSPAVSLPDGIARTWRWIRENN